MKKITIAIITLTALATSTAIAAVDDAASDKFVREFMPSCINEAQVSREPVEIPVPENLTVRILSVETDDYNCAGKYLEVRTPTRIYVGYPWLLSAYDGSIKQKIERFAWERMQQTVKVTVAASPAFDGLIPATVSQVTEYGPIPITGYIDSGENIFFPGEFYDVAASTQGQRLSTLQELLETSPAKGDPASKVTLIEFSDFQCPSCKRATNFLEPMLDKYLDRIIYRRVDFPLFMSHPWALPAAILGRAIYRQNPDAFWTFKKTIYANQSQINVFTLEDFASGIVEDFELDRATYESDVASDEVRKQILEGIGLATGLQVNATPTFWINGSPISAGEDGADLDAAIEAALEN